MERTRLIRMLSIAMRVPDDLVLKLTYRDRDGCSTRRLVSPIRLVGQDKFLALCLCREEPRHFCLDGCSDVQFVAADEVLMPVEIETL